MPSQAGILGSGRWWPEGWSSEDDGDEEEEEEEEEPEPKEGGSDRVTDRVFLDGNRRLGLSLWNRFMVGGNEREWEDEEEREFQFET